VPISIEAEDAIQVQKSGSGEPRPEDALSTDRGGPGDPSAENGLGLEPKDEPCVPEDTDRWWEWI
jgi:hypothetical protein